MVTQPSPRGWTYAEFARLPDDGNRYEVIDGELCVTPSPRPVHQWAGFQLGFVLENFLLQHGMGGLVLLATDVLFADGDYLEPDLVFVRRERGEIVTERGVEGVPDLVVEVLSSSTAARDRGIKRQRYAWFGVPEYWVLDLDAGQMEVYHLTDDPNRPYSVGNVVTWQPVPGGPVLEFSVANMVRDYQARSIRGGNPSSY